MCNVLCSHESSCALPAIGGPGLVDPQLPVLCPYHTCGAPTFHTCVLSLAHTSVTQRLPANRGPVGSARSGAQVRGPPCAAGQSLRWQVPSLAARSCSGGPLPLPCSLVAVAEGGRWSPATHRHWPDSFKVATRLLLLTSSHAASPADTRRAAASSRASSNAACCRWCC